MQEEWEIASSDIMETSVKIRQFYYAVLLLPHMHAIDPKFENPHTDFFVRFGWFEAMNNADNDVLLPSTEGLPSKIIALRNTLEELIVLFHDHIQTQNMWSITELLQIELELYRSLGGVFEWYEIDFAQNELILSMRVMFKTVRFS
jgi:hypothetical protein